MKKFFNTKNTFSILTIIFFIIVQIIFPIKTFANFDEKDKMTDITMVENTTRNSAGNIIQHILNKTFYIKNAYLGRYLDVYGGIATDGTNVQQCAFNGGNNQKWYIQYNGDALINKQSDI